jgi:hypothetical protein
MSGHFEHGAWIETKPDETITFENCKIKLDDNPESEFVCCNISFKPKYDDAVDALSRLISENGMLNTSLNIECEVEDHIRFEKGKSIGWSDQFKEEFK